MGPASLRRGPEKYADGSSAPDEACETRMLLTVVGGDESVPRLRETPHPAALLVCAGRCTAARAYVAVGVPERGSLGNSRAWEMEL